ncbi:MAG: biotin--[acetyl-CoA-carboxylase] ligase [Myxococcota bacterium]
MSSWDRRRIADLAPPERGLWRALGGSDELSVTHAPQSRPQGFWKLAAIVGYAMSSQYDDLHTAIGAGLELPGPVACVALAGSSFHGQRGRPWRGGSDNLFLTVGFTPQAPIERLIPALTMLPAVTVAETISKLAPNGGAGIKWVNDILIDGRKVAGVLSATHVQGQTVQSAVLGIGVNIATTPHVEPTPFVPEVCSLRDVGLDVDLGTFFNELLECLAIHYRELVARGGGELLAAYRRLSIIMGQRVRIWDTDVVGGKSKETWPEPLAAGVVTRIDADLSLRLAGQPEPVQRGRLALESACEALGL